MLEFVRKHWTYLLGALLLHVAFVGIFGLTMLKFARKPPPATLAIQAVVVDRSVIDRAARQQEREEDKQGTRISAARYARRHRAGAAYQCFVARDRWAVPCRRADGR